MRQKKTSEQKNPKSSQKVCEQSVGLTTAVHRTYNVAYTDLAGPGNLAVQ